MRTHVRAVLKVDYWFKFRFSLDLSLCFLANVHVRYLLSPVRLSVVCLTVICRL